MTRANSQDTTQIAQHVANIDQSESDREMISETGTDPLFTVEEEAVSAEEHEAVSAENDQVNVDDEKDGTQPPAV